MNEEFAAHMQARLEELVANEKFYRKRDRTLVTPRVFRTQIPGRGADYAEGDNAPNVCWAITSGRIEGRLLEFTVVIVVGIWTPGGIEEGSADIERLVMTVLGVANEHGMAGHRLSDVDFHLGVRHEDDYLDGTQPHPLHEGQIKLRFSAPIKRIPCNK